MARPVPDFAERKRSPNDGLIVDYGPQAANLSPL